MNLRVTLAFYLAYPGYNMYNVLWWCILKSQTEAKVYPASGWSKRVPVEDLLIILATYMGYVNFCLFFPDLLESNCPRDIRTDPKLSRDAWCLRCIEPFFIPECLHGILINDFDIYYQIGLLKCAETTVWVLLLMSSKWLEKHVFCIACTMTVVVVPRNSCSIWNIVLHT